MGHLSYYPGLSRDRTRTGGSTVNSSYPGHTGHSEQTDQGWPNGPAPALTAADSALTVPSRSVKLGGLTNSGGLDGSAGEVGGHQQL